MDYHRLSGTLSNNGHYQRYRHLLREEAFLRFYAQQALDQTLDLNQTPKPLCDPRTLFLA